MNNKKIYTGALCLEDKKNCYALRAQRPWLTLRQGDQLFSLLTEVVAIPQVSLECSQLLGRFICFCLLHPRRPRPGSSWFREETLTFPPLSTALYLRGWSPCGKRERERERKVYKKATQLFTPSTITTPLSTQTFFFVSGRKKLYFVL